MPKDSDSFAAAFKALRLQSQTDSLRELGESLDSSGFTIEESTLPRWQSGARVPRKKGVEDYTVTAAFREAIAAIKHNVTSVGMVALIRFLVTVIYTQPCIRRIFADYSAVSAMTYSAVRFVLVHILALFESDAPILQVFSCSMQLTKNGGSGL